MPRLNKKQQDEVQESFEQQYNEEFPNADIKKDHPMKDWMNMLKQQKENFQSYTSVLKEGLIIVNTFLTKVFSKEFKSDDLSILFTICCVIMVLCSFVFPITSAIFIWTSFPIFKIWSTAFLIGSFACTGASIVFIADEKS